MNCKDSMISIVIPIKEFKLLNKFLGLNQYIFEKYEVIVIDSRGGEILKPMSIYLTPKIPLWEARKLGYSLVKTPYILNLDANIVLPKSYLERALRILESDPKIGVVALDYEILQGHLGFGTSLWRTELLKELYDWNPEEGHCECVYMWAKIRKKGYKIETINARAIRLKEEHKIAKS